VTCISCHSPHHAKEHEALLIEKQPLLCYTCHGETKADFSKPIHHRVNEGLINCTDCHNVHGSFIQSRMLRATAGQDAICYRCHTEKQGPWVFEHLPVKTEGCTACHTPHGSVTPRLLRIGQVNLLCLECHTPSSTPNTRAGDSITQPPIGPGHQQSQKYVSCTLCHVAIHGSNADPAFLK
jgi:DmsE family decaheme c-type cytochrome